MYTESPKTIIYYPAGSPDELILVSYGDILAAETTEDVSVNIQQVMPIAVPWVHHYARGGAMIMMTVMPMTIHGTSAAAERWSDDVRDQILLAPCGRIRMYSAYDDDTPTRIVDYSATVKAVPQAWQPDHAVLSGNQACAVMRYDLILTHPIPQ